METTYYESQTERDETKYLHQMEGSNFATWNYIKGCRLGLHHQTFILKYVQ